MFPYERLYAIAAYLTSRSLRQIVKACNFAAIACFLAFLPPAHSATVAPVTLLTIDGAIGPANADYVVRGIRRAATDGTQLVILKMDTPGGLDTSMRSIIKAILTSPVPIASYVAPSGARAASAGTYIMYASHIAAMAPGTNLGAATPVQIGGPGIEPDASKPATRDKNAAPAKTQGKSPDPDIDNKDKTNPMSDVSPMTRKQVNDAAAYIRGLAQMRGRNSEWAERAVREAVSVSAEEALKLHVIDYVASDEARLNALLDGKTLTVLGQERVLQTRGATIANAAPDWRAELLAAITNPSIALMLLTIGIYGLIFEFMNPGFGVPGVVGAIFLLLALYALQLLPVNYAGLGLIILGICFMIAEVFIGSFGVLGVGGIAAFVVGALILIDTEMPGYGIPIAMIVTIAVSAAFLFAATTGIAVKTRRRTIVKGLDNLTGTTAEVMDDMQSEGWAHVNGETWRIVSSAPLRRAQKVRVIGRNGLLLQVAPLGNNEKGT